jgi:GNAT superfamily N-acetyltransferase
MKPGGLLILTSRDDVAPFVNDVRKAADAQTMALGFFPATVYVEFARREQLYVAIRVINGVPVYAGHLLFDLQFPRANILQMYCAPDSRRTGVAAKLLDTLRDTLTRDGFVAIYARVAEDLTDATAFWSSQNFYQQRIAPGSAARKRRIAVRVFELESPQLFPASGLGAAGQDPLGLQTQVTGEPPLYLIDLNVLFDLHPRRLRHAAAINLFRACNEGTCRLGISSEIRNELRRHQPEQGRTDPMIELIATLPEFVSELPAKESRTLLSDLASIVFPAQFRNDQLSINDNSDLKHLATVIAQQLSGFITNEVAMLQAADTLHHMYGIQVLSPEAFEHQEQQHGEVASVHTVSESKLTTRAMETGDANHVRTLLGQCGLSNSAINHSWMAPNGLRRATHQVVVYCDKNCVGYVTWPMVTEGAKYSAHAAIDEAHAEAPDVARELLRHIIDRMEGHSPCILSLTLPPHQSYLREVAFSLGFRAAHSHSPLAKVIAGCVLTSSTWKALRSGIARGCDLKLPEVPPRFVSASQTIELYSPDGNRRYLPLDLLETLLSPVLFCLPGRPAVISPIERRFAEPLLGHSRQASLLPAHSASLYAARHYLCDPRSLKHLQRGALMLFYESSRGGGQQAIVAVARIVESYLRRRDALQLSDLQSSVLRPDTLDQIGQADIKAVSVIDNIFPLRKSVPLAKLQLLGCGNANQLITTHPVTDDQLNNILLEGFSDD